MKICTKCNKSKEETEFYAKTPTRLHARCKLCMNEFRRNQYVLNKERENAVNKKYWAKTREHWRVHRKKYYAANKEKIAIRTRKHRALPETIERQRQYVKKHATRYRLSHAAWRKRNPEKMRQKYLVAYAKDRTNWNVCSANRRARIKKAGGKFTLEQWRALKAQYNNTCLCCGVKEPEKRMTIDHIMPLILGGSNDISNIQPLCWKCNRTKWNKHIDYRILEAA